jgi:2-methylcitrate dehydratase PrpD
MATEAWGNAVRSRWDVLVRCGELAATARAEDAPAGVRERLRLLTASTLAAIFAAEHDDDVRRVTTWALRSSGPHPLLPGGESVARLEAIVAGVVRARAHDFDEFALLGRPGAAAVVVPFVLGAAADFPYAEVESAQLVGVEIALRFGLASLLAPHPGDDPASTNVIAGAIVAARILRLDAARTSEALALALAQPQIPALPLVSEGPAHAATEVLAGVLAAELAFDGARARGRLGQMREASASSFVFARGAFEGLGGRWWTETIHPKEHPGPVYVQTAISAAHEVRAQAEAVRRKPLVARDLSEVVVETTILGAARHARDRVAEVVARALLGHPVGTTLAPSSPEGAVARDLRSVLGRIDVRHAWELTSELLWRGAAAIELPRLFGAAGVRELALAPLRLRRAIADLDVAGPPIAQIGAEVTRIAASLGRGRPASRVLAMPVATRIRATLRDGTRLGADRALPRGAPGVPAAEARAMVRRKLVEASTPRLGVRRAERLADLVLDPPPKLRVREVLSAMVRR